MQAGDTCFYYAKQWHDAILYDRSKLLVGTTVLGSVIVIEMDAVLFRAARSAGFREQGDCFPMITARDDKMVVGQFGSFNGPFLQALDGDLEEGDVILTNDPYLCNIA